MQKYKVTASKEQKKYSVIISAQSPAEAKEKLHKDGYSILSISEYSGEEISGKKFIFSVEQNGVAKNGIIVGSDIFKVYKKLKEELGYHVIYLYPEGDEAKDSSEKKQLIMDQLEIGYKLQKQKEKNKGLQIKKDEEFYLKHQLEETYHLIETVIDKLENIITHKAEHNISEEKFQKIEYIYEKLKQLKKSTNLVKLREIGEKALIKIAEIQVEDIQTRKNKESEKLLEETNSLLKQIGSKENFKTSSNEFTKGIKMGIRELISNFADFKSKNSKEKQKSKEIDTESYSFLKTLLLLEKYKEKLKNNTSEIRAHIFIFINIFHESEVKDKILLKRKVIKQNIALLKAKKNGRVNSYTGIKKGLSKTLENIYSYSNFLGTLFLTLSIVYSFSFLAHSSFLTLGWGISNFRSESVSFFILFFCLGLIFHFLRYTFLTIILIVLTSFFHIFVNINF